MRLQGKTKLAPQVNKQPEQVWERVRANRGVPLPALRPPHTWEELVFTEAAFPFVGRGNLPHG